jgi:hypothetical protein
MPPALSQTRLPVREDLKGGFLHLGRVKNRVLPLSRHFVDLAFTLRFAPTDTEITSAEQFKRFPFGELRGRFSRRTPSCRHRIPTDRDDRLRPGTA